jgi:hypothetical protein
MSATGTEDESGGGDTLNSGTLDALNKANAKAKRRDEVPSFSVDVCPALKEKKKKKKKKKNPTKEK